VNGSVWATGPVVVNGSSRILGDVVASKVTLAGSSSTAIAGSVSASGDVAVNTNKIAGSVWAGGAIQMSYSSQIAGNVVANGLSTLVGSKIGGSAWVTGAVTSQYGSSTVTGHLTAGSLSGTMVTTGGRTINNVGPGGGVAPQTTLTMPSTTDWFDYSYTASDWPGFTEHVIGSDCRTNAALEAARSQPGPDVIDARLCANGFAPSRPGFDMTDDLAIIANKFDINGSSSITSASDARLWLIVPDDVKDGSPTTTSEVGLTKMTILNVAQTINVMVYTPGLVEHSGPVTFTGQVFAGSVRSGNESTMTYAPVGLPGAH